MKTNILHIIPGAEGTEAHVAQITDGVSVTVFDVDAGEYYPSARIFHGEDAEIKALEYAATINPAAGPDYSKPFDLPAAIGQAIRVSAENPTWTIYVYQIGPRTFSTPNYKLEDYGEKGLMIAAYRQGASVNA